MNNQEVKRLRETSEYFEGYDLEKGKRLRASYQKKIQNEKYTEELQKEHERKRKEEFMIRRDKIMVRFNNAYQQITHGRQTRLTVLYNECRTIDDIEELVEKYEKDQRLLLQANELYSNLTGKSQEQFKNRYDKMKTYESKLRVFNIHNENYISVCKKRQEQINNLYKRARELLIKIKNHCVQKEFIQSYNNSNTYEDRKLVITQLENYVHKNECPQRDDSQ